MKEIFDSYNVYELRKFASSYNKNVKITGASKMKKPQLIDALLKHKEHFKDLKMKDVKIPLSVKKDEVKAKTTEKPEVKKDVKKDDEKEDKKNLLGKEKNKLLTDLNIKYARQSIDNIIRILNENINTLNNKCSALDYYKVIMKLRDGLKIKFTDNYTFFKSVIEDKTKHQKANDILKKLLGPKLYFYLSLLLNKSFNTYCEENKDLQHPKYLNPKELIKDIEKSNQTVNKIEKKKNDEKIKSSNSIAIYALKNFEIPIAIKDQNNEKLNKEYEKKKDKLKIKILRDKGFREAAELRVGNKKVILNNIDHVFSSNTINYDSNINNLKKLFL